MKDNLLIGLSRSLFGLPRSLWQRHVESDAHHTAARLGFMTTAHHLVRDFSVRELPRVGRPLSPELIAQGVNLPLAAVNQVLDELEENKTFLFRNPEGAVTWAYPVTVEETPHRVTLSTGEALYAAWGIDAIAVPFVQGQLRQTPLSVRIETECVHCHQPLHLEIDSELNYRVVEEGAAPLVFVPTVDFDKLEDPSIIDAFWRNSVFFWSEEHAREFRHQVGQMRGVYMTLAQSTEVTRSAQGALFAFPREG